MYNRTFWNNNAAPYIDSTNLNKIEVGIVDAHNDILANANAIQLLENQGWHPWITYTDANDSSFVANLDRIFADTTAAPFSIFLPATPNIGDAVIIVDVSGSFGTNALTIDGGGETIMGSLTLELDVNNIAVELTYSGATNGWRITSKA